jgi:hypothetical protein
MLPMNGDRCVLSGLPANKRMQRTGISVPLIDNLPHDVVVARPLKRGVRCFAISKLSRETK